jgi:3'(2'), 5'-bisphosphate nucleotidase
MVIRLCEGTYTEHQDVSQMDFTAPNARRSLMEGLIAAAVNAGAAIMAVFDSDFDVQVKADQSPVTVADQAAEAVILEALARLAPGVPVVAEEEAAAGRIPEVGARFFLVDPLDGTKEFVRRGSDFTVNIGLIEDGAPTLGVVFAPARDALYVGDVALGEAWRETRRPTDSTGGAKIALKVKPPGDRLTAVASKSHDTPETEAYLKTCGVDERVSIGSSLKFCLVASGEADLYPRPAPTCEWDTAAGHAVLLAAGGVVYDLSGAPLPYGKPKFFNPGFLALGGVRGLPPLGAGLDGAEPQ